VGVVEFSVTIPVPPTSAKSHKTWDSAKAIAWLPARALASPTRSGEVIWLITTLDATQLPPVQAMVLYRARWQIELLFKRLKSLLHLDTSSSRQGPTAKSWMLARLIAARMTLWALRGAILGKGPWLVVQSEQNLDRLRNSPRKRTLVSDQLARSAHISQPILI
jgi:hypothetical protein